MKRKCAKGTCRRVLPQGYSFKWCPRCRDEAGEHGRNGHDDDMTEAELDQMIHEQMQCLPKWWHESSENVQRIRKTKS